MTFTVTRVMPYLRVKDCAAAIDFYKQAFGAAELYRLTIPNGRIANAQLKIGEIEIQLADETNAPGARSPQSLGGSTVAIDLLVDDATALFDQALSAGATVQYPLVDQFYGLRQGQLVDPYGHLWSISQRLEEITPAEMQRRLEAMLTKGN
ncbi:MAG: VOC family protein [Anaerolineae bacterium]|nr:VOC family protein [Anaerolineae bacterium]